MTPRQPFGCPAMLLADGTALLNAAGAFAVNATLQQSARITSLRRVGSHCCLTCYVPSCNAAAAAGMPLQMKVTRQQLPCSPALASAAAGSGQKGLGCYLPGRRSRWA